MPFVVQIVSKIVFASAADEMKRRGCTVNMVTKLFNSIGKQWSVLADVLCPSLQE